MSNNNFIKDYSVSVIIPAKNEQGTIKKCIQRMPSFGKNLEIIFVEGGSKDKTWDEILRVKQLCNTKFNIKALKQTEAGKANAVKMGFAAASNEVLMILDADLTVAPEELPLFYTTLCNNQNCFINGCRLINQGRKRTMPTLNLIGNKFFSVVCSWLLKQKIGDTLCGTKVLLKADYLKIEANSFFRNIDPFGDFELLFSAYSLGLSITSLPVSYYKRSYGKSNIAPLKDGFLLLRMCFIALKKLRLGYKI